MVLEKLESYMKKKERKKKRKKNPDRLMSFTKLAKNGPHT